MQAPHKSEGPAGTGPIADTKANTADCATGTPSAKEFATAQAGFAFVGHELYPNPQGGYIARKWGMERKLSTWCEVLRFAEMIGVRHGI